jgi:hypothetical protein
MQAFYGLMNGVMPDMSRNAGERAPRGPNGDDNVYLIDERVDFGELPAFTSASATFGKGWPTSQLPCVIH